MDVLGFLFPKRCIQCKAFGSYICPTCISTIRYLEYQVCPMCLNPAIGGITHPKCIKPFGIDGCFALSHYEGVIKKAIHVMKYKHIYDISHLLSRILVSNMPTHIPHGDMVIPVPLHQKRMRERGYNQSEKLASWYAHMVGIPMMEGSLVRIKHTTPQFGLHKEERRKNMQGAFSWIGGDEIRGKTVMLVDDVTTTCSTLRSCASVLKHAGAKCIWAIVLAHG